jgi:hypothetical protein
VYIVTFLILSICSGGDGSGKATTAKSARTRNTRAGKKGANFNCVCLIEDDDNLQSRNRFHFADAALSLSHERDITLHRGGQRAGTCLAGAFDDESFSALGQGRRHVNDRAAAQRRAQASRTLFDSFGGALLSCDRGTLRRLRPSKSSTVAIMPSRSNFTMTPTPSGMRT